MALSLKLLGEFALRDEDGVELTLPTRKTRALLAYLAVNADKPQRRERLRTLLWGDRGEQQARQSLNQALRSIRRLGEESGIALLDSEGERVMLIRAALDCDVQRLRALAKDQLAQAAELYDGTLLDGFLIPDPAFEEWLLSTRSELHALACDTLEAAANMSDDPDMALRCARRLVTLDPLREEAHRRLMQLLCQSGDRAGALRQYHICSEFLERELQVRPDEKTQALFEKIRGDTTATAYGAESTDARPALPNKPSIAVLPFDNLGADPNQEFFADGIAEDIITDLSRFHSLFVIARGSSFAFKGQALDAQTIATKLGVHYLLEGSVRASGSRIRIAAQLIEAKTGSHIWAERFDRELENIFSIQDEVTTAIVRAIAPEIDRRDRLLAQGRSTEQLDAWSQFQRGMSAFYSSTEADLRSAAILFDKATALDPFFATAYAYAATTRCRLVTEFGATEKNELITEAEQRLDTALALEPRNVATLFASGVLETLRGNHETGIDALQQAISLNPNSAFNFGILGWILQNGGRPAEAIDTLDRAMRLSPFDPSMALFLTSKMGALFQLDRYQDCVELGRKAIRLPGSLTGAFVWMTTALICLDRREEAEDVWSKLKLRFPAFSVESAEWGRERARSNAYRRRIEILRDAGFGN